MKRLLSAVLCFLLLLSILPVPAIAEGDLHTSATPVSVAEIAIRPPDGADAALAIGESMALFVTITPTEATNTALLWTSGNDACATVDDNGLVTAIGEGVATITATATDGSGCFGVLDIVVEAPLIVPESVPASTRVSSITVSAESSATGVMLGDTLQFHAAVAPVDAVDKTVVWNVTNGTGAASIDSHGLLTPAAVGIVTVTATANDGSGVLGDYTLEILAAVPAPLTPVAVSSVTVSAEGNATSVMLGGTLQFLAAVAPDAAVDKAVTWSVVNGTGTASIDSHGLLTPSTVGAVTVTATAKDGSGVLGDYALEILAVTPAAIPVTTIAISVEENVTTVAIGGTLALSATVTPADAGDPTVTWSVANGTGTASIDSGTGILTGGTAGDVTVTVTANDGSGVTGTLVVTVSPFAGNGTAKAPYAIGTAEELAQLAQLVNGGNAAFSGAYYRQTASINLNGTSWTPIGMSDSPFIGTFDGRGKGITGLAAGGSGSGYFGLFSETRAATLTGIVMEQTALSLGGTYAGAGAIVGHMSGGTLTKSYASGVIDTTFTGGATGGLVGVLVGGAITDCMNATKITAVQNAGGIAGRADATSSISTCYGSGLTATTDGSDTFGMIVAAPAEGMTVQNCYAIGGADPLAHALPWIASDRQESFFGFDFTNVWTMGTGAYYHMPVLQDSPFTGDASWVREDVEYAKGYRPWSYDVPNYYASRRRLMSDPLETSYETPDLPEIRNQNPYGTCWAHSAICAAEVARIKADAEDSSVDYSEAQLVWYHFTGPKIDSTTYNDPLNNFGNDHMSVNSASPYPYNDLWQIGSNDVEAAMTLSTWMGVVREERGITSYDAIPRIKSSGLSYAYAFSKDVAHLSGMQMIPWSAGDEAIKRAIKQYGAVTISYCASFDSFNSYYFMSAGSYNATINEEYLRFPSDHAVTIVGWDDTIPKERFWDWYTNTAPSSDGAWIVRNSWGSGFGNDGYFYMSYETKHNTWSNDFAAFWQFSEADNYERCYQYDGTTSGAYSLWDSDAYIANVFTAAADNEAIKAVSFWMEREAGISFTVDVYTDLTDDANPVSGTLAATVSGRTEYPGYYTVELTTPVFVPRGEKFAIVVCYRLPAGETTLKIPLDWYSVDLDEDYILYYSYAETGQSFRSPDGGTTWWDMNEHATSTSGCNYRIKAFGISLIRVTDIRVSSDSDNVEVDDTLQMEATITPDTATMQTVAWSVAPATTNPGNATIDADTGLLTGVAVGDVVVTATANDDSRVTGTKTITILPKKVTSITVEAPTYVEVNKSAICTANVLPINAGNRAVIWSVTPDDGSATIVEEPASTGVPTCTLTSSAEGQVVVTATATDGSGKSGSVTVTIVAEGSLHTVTVDTESIGFSPASELYVDGAKYSGGSLAITERDYSTNLLTEQATNAVVYNYNTSETSSDPHTTYPTNMSVWTLTYNDATGDYDAERISEFDDLLQYAGSSIRIVGEKGIRLISGVPIATRNRLINATINGYRLEEYGTVLAWANTIDTEHPLTLRDGVMSGVAYKRGVKDPIFRQTGTAVQYTNVVTRLTLEKCRDDLLMRPYIKLKHVETGKELMLYGGIVSRSIGYIAWQNRAAFPAGSAAYNYIWDIINYVYNGNYPS